MAKLNEGDTVTWGSGVPRGRIDGFDAVEFEYAGMWMPVACVTLLEDQAGPCGKVFRAGTSADIPLSELRRVD